MHKQNLL